MKSLRTAFLAVALLACSASNAQIITTVAGNVNTTPGYGGDGGPASAATISASQIAFDSAGNLYFTTEGLHRIRKVAVSASGNVSGSGTISTIAGTGSPGFSGQGTPAANALINFPMGLAFDSRDNLYFADVGNYRIRRIDPVTGYIHNVTGNGVSGSTGDGIPAINAGIVRPFDVAIDREDNIFILSTSDDLNITTIRRIDAVTGVISTVVNTAGTRGYSGDGGPASAAQLESAHVIQFDLLGNLYIAGDTRVRKVTANGSGLIDGNSIISTALGTGTAGYATAGDPATSTPVNRVRGLAISPSNDLYYSDQNNYHIGKVDAATNLVSFVAGTHGNSGPAGDGGPATSAVLILPRGLAVDRRGNLFLVSSLPAIRKIIYNSAPITPSAPRNLVATPGDGMARFNFNPPLSNGGAAITQYSVHCAGGHSGSAAQSPVFVTGLTNGTPYNCRAFATNAVGDGLSTAPVSVTPNGAVPLPPPSAPQNLLATAGVAQITLTFTPPASGTAPTGYVAICSAGGNDFSATGTASPLVVNGLTNGTTYACTVHAESTAGDGAAAGPVNATPSAVPMPPPSAPQNFTATPGSEQIALAFTPPATGAPPTGYVATCSANGTDTSETGSASPLTISGLANGTTYACSVYAESANGNGTVAGPINATPMPISYVPENVVVTPGDASATISFDPPITGVPQQYILTCQPDNISLTSPTAMPFVLTGLVNDTTYDCVLRADHAITFGDYAFSFTPHGTPPATVPTLNHFGLALMALLIGAFGEFARRRA